MFANRSYSTTGESADGTPAQRGGPTETNRGRQGWIASAAAGGALLAFGIKRRSPVGAVAALAGGWLLYRATTAEGESDEASGRSNSGELVTERSITISRAAEELHERWRDPETLNRVFADVAEITAVDEDRQRWTLNAPFGRQVEREMRVVEDRPGELLRWESVEGTPRTEGSVRFRPAPGDRGTEMTLRLRFEPPGGRVGGAVARGLGVVPDAAAGTALDRFKSLLETGEMPTLERNSSARGPGGRSVMGSPR